ncbi:MAG: HdeD family acid-resistance protein [Pseudorhodoplanes sp.]
MPIDITSPQSPVQLRFDVATLRKYSTWFLVYGIVMALLGVIGILMPGIASLASTIFIGWLLVAGGALGLYAVFSAGKSAPGFWWNLITALLYLAAGIVILVNPIRGVLTLTIVLAAYLLAGGAAKIFLAFGHKRDVPMAWGWVLFSGVIDIVLAFLIIAGLPSTAVWAIGLLVGINLFMMGVAIIFSALGCKKMAAHHAAPAEKKA